MTNRAYLAAGVVLALAAPLAAQSAGLQLALDKPVEFAVQDATILEVFEKLSAVTGIRFVVPEETLACLPYGDQMRLSVKLKNAKPRTALTQMLPTQALRWEIVGEAVHIVPTEALQRIGRRATYDELQLLGALNSAELKPAAEAGEVLSQLRQVTGEKRLDIVVHVQIDKDADYARAERVLPGTAVQWLDMLCHSKGWTWYLWGDDIIVLDQRVQIRRQLQKQVSLRYQSARLSDVLRDLADQAGVKLQMTPGVMNYLPVETRTNFNLMMADASIEAALDVISGETGLQFLYTADGIQVDASDRLKEGFGAVRQRPRSPFFLRMSMPSAEGVTIDVFLPADDLPPALVEAIQERKKDFIERLCEEYGAPMEAPVETP